MSAIGPTCSASATGSRLLTSTACYFSAIFHLPLTTAAAISFTSPFIVVGLSIFVLGELVGPRRWMAVAIGFLGMLFIIRPGFGGFHWAMGLVFCSATSYACYQVMTRRLAGRDNSLVTTTYTALVGVVMGTLVLPFFWQNPNELWHVLVFLSLGFFGPCHEFALRGPWSVGGRSFGRYLRPGRPIGAKPIRRRRTQRTRTDRGVQRLGNAGAVLGSVLGPQHRPKSDIAPGLNGVQPGQQTRRVTLKNVCVNQRRNHLVATPDGAIGLGHGHGVNVGAVAKRLAQGVDTGDVGEQAQLDLRVVRAHQGVAFVGHEGAADLAALFGADRNVL